MITKRFYHLAKNAIFISSLSSFCFMSLWIYLFSVFHINGIFIHFIQFINFIEYVAFWIWLLWVNMIFKEFIHMVTYINQCYMYIMTCTFYLSVYQLMDIWVVCIFRLLWIMLLWTLTYKFLCWHMFSVLIKYNLTRIHLLTCRLQMVGNFKNVIHV